MSSFLFPLTQFPATGQLFDAPSSVSVKIACASEGFVVASVINRLAEHQATSKTESTHKPQGPINQQDLCKKWRPDDATLTISSRECALEEAELGLNPKTEVD